MSDFRNASPPHGTIFSDVPDHIDGDDYTWTEKAAPAGVYIVPADDGARPPYLTKYDLVEMRLAELNEQVKELQAQLAELGELRELNIQLKAMRSSPPIDLSALAYQVAETIRRSLTDEPSRE